MVGTSPIERWRSRLRTRRSRSPASEVITSGFIGEASLRESARFDVADEFLRRPRDVFAQLRVFFHERRRIFIKPQHVVTHQHLPVAMWTCAGQVLVSYD